jgi:lipoprotein-anchoring transpeptidase ErfK/SrfK
VVDLSSQRVSLYATDGSVLAVVPVSTGSKAHPTPTGRFHVTSRSRKTFYTPHPWVTMEYMTRFNSNIGFHAIPRDRGEPIWTPLGRYGVSHGCVRLRDANAAILYRYLPDGATVVVQR